MAFTTFSSGTKIKSSEVNTNFLSMCPIGTVVGWHKSFPNTPALPDEWVELNGQTINDSESVYDGQTVDDWNGEGRFLKGASTSGTDNDGTVNFKIISYVSGGNSTGFQSSGGASGLVTNGYATGTYGYAVTMRNGYDLYTEKKAGNVIHTTIVWIMRIK